MRYSLCKVRVKVWPYFRVLIENNNSIYSWSSFLPLTIVGEECHVVELYYKEENFCISKHIYSFLRMFNVKSTNNGHFVYQNTFIHFFECSMLSQQTMGFLLHYATAYVIKQIIIV